MQEPRCEREDLQQTLAVVAPYDDGGEPLFGQAIYMNVDLYSCARCLEQFGSHEEAEADLPRREQA
jgi:hypothetical protein